MRCCTQDQWQINYSPVHQKKNKKKKGKKKPLLILLQQYPNGHGSRTPKLIRVQPQRNALTLLMAVNFALKKKKKKERKERKENFFSEEIDRSLFYSWVILAIGHDFVITSFIRVLTTIG